MIIKAKYTKLTDEEKIKEITSIAEKLIKKNGFKDLFLNDCLAGCSFSRGTFFSIVPNKETVITYLALKGIGLWAKYLDRLNGYEARARELLLAQSVAHVLFSAKHPILFKSIILANTYAPALEVDAAVIDRFENELNKISNHLFLIINKAIADKDLTLPDYFNTNDFKMAIWNGMIGTGIGALRANADEVNIQNEQYILLIRFVCDNLNWLPLSKGTDYSAVKSHIINKYYEQEVTMLQKKLGIP